jgi:pre-mRNA-splicing factor ATP-dependent RNA helicase DHX15/PRP43
VLTLKKLGLDDIVHFDYMDPPAPETLMRALEQLNNLEALDDDGNMTDTGLKMSEYPLEPTLAKVLLTSTQHSCTAEAATIVALLSVPTIFMRPKDQAKAADEAKSKFAHEDGDHLTLLNAYTMFINRQMSTDWCYHNYINFRAIKQANDIREQLIRIMEKQNITIRQGDLKDKEFFTGLKKCLLSGFFMQVAHLERSGHYITLKDDQVVAIHPSSVLDHKPVWCIY